MTIETDRTTCSYCPKLCRHECPAAIAERTEVATPTFKQQLARLAHAGEVRLDPDLARTFYKCTGCLGSKASCRWEIDLEPSMREARVQAVREGVAPPEVARVLDRFRARGQPYDRDIRRDLADLAPPSLTGREKARVALFPSCTSLARYPDEVVDARLVLDATSAPATVPDFTVVLPDPPCCGYPLDALGLADAFAEHAKRVVQSLSGYPRIATTGAACAWTLATRYPEVGAKLPGKVVHLVQELAARADAIRILRRGRSPIGPFAYHDPCYLGRHLGVFEEPRATLAAVTGEAPIELDRNRKNAYCSGAGAGYALTHPGPAREVALRAIDAFRRSGARVLVTGCPSARRLFEKADPTAAVTSLSSVVASAIGKSQSS